MAVCRNHNYGGCILKKGKLISFSGADGSGKTTMIKKTKTWLESQGHNVSVVRLGIYNQRTVVLKAIRQISRKPKKFPAPTFVKSIVRFLDMWLRYLKILPKRLKGDIILCDRFFYDLAFYTKDPFSKFLARLSPKPSVAIFISVSPHELARRKKEYSKQELEIHTRRMNQLIKKFNLIKIKSTSIKMTFNQIKSHISNKLGL